MPHILYLVCQFSTSLKWYFQYALYLKLIVQNVTETILERNIFHCIKFTDWTWYHIIYDHTLVIQKLVYRYRFRTTCIWFASLVRHWSDIATMRYTLYILCRTWRRPYWKEIFFIAITLQIEHGTILFKITYWPSGNWFIDIATAHLVSGLQV